MYTIESEQLSDREPDEIPVVPSAAMANTDSIPTAFDPRALRAGRLVRLRGMMADEGYAAAARRVSSKLAACCGHVRIR